MRDESRLSFVTGIFFDILTPTSANTGTTYSLITLIILLYYSYTYLFDNIQCSTCTSVSISANLNVKRLMADFDILILYSNVECNNS